jgi:hypothetical protein
MKGGVMAGLLVKPRHLRGATISIEERPGKE